MRLRLDFLLRDLSQYFRIYLVTFTHTFFIHGHGINVLKIIYDVKSKLICSYNSYGNNISDHFQNA